MYWKHTVMEGTVHQRCSRYKYAASRRQQGVSCPRGRRVSWEVLQAVTDSLEMFVIVPFEPLVPQELCGDATHVRQYAVALKSFFPAPSTPHLPPH